MVQREDETLVVRLLRKDRRRLLILERRHPVPSLKVLEHLGLGKREAEVLSWVARGKTNQEIATILSISTKTVKKHVERIFEKLGVESRTAAAAVAMQA